MSLSLSLTNQKISEKLLILNDRCIGILTRIYNIKKVSPSTILISIASKTRVPEAFSRSAREAPTTCTVRPVFV